MNETLKRLSSLPILLQRSFWWRQCSVIVLSPSPLSPPISWDLGPSQYLSVGTSTLNNQSNQQTKTRTALRICFTTISNRRLHVVRSFSTLLSLAGNSGRLIGQQPQEQRYPFLLQPVQYFRVSKQWYDSHCLEF